MGEGHGARGRRGRLPHGGEFLCILLGSGYGRRFGQPVQLRLFLPELGFLLCAMGVIIVAVRKKRLRLMLILTGFLTAAFWIGMTIS